jgi:hypothetical protein
MKWWADVQECNTTCQNLYPCDPDIAKICRILVPVGSSELAFKMCMESEKDGYTQCQTAEGLCASNCILGLPDCYMMYPAANNPGACLPPGSEVLGLVAAGGGDSMIGAIPFVPSGVSGKPMPCGSLSPEVCASVCVENGAACLPYQPHPHDPFVGPGRLYYCKGGYPTCTCSYLYPNGDNCTEVWPLGLWLCGLGPPGP